MSTQFHPRPPKVTQESAEGRSFGSCFGCLLIVECRLLIFQRSSTSHPEALWEFSQLFYANQWRIRTCPRLLPPLNEAILTDAPLRKHCFSSRLFPDLTSQNSVTTQNLLGRGRLFYLITLCSSERKLEASLSSALLLASPIS